MAKAEKKILFITHVGDPGGAEYKMISLCKAVIDSAEIMLFDRGNLETLLKNKGIKCSVLPMPEAMKEFRRENGIRGILKTIPSVFSMLGNIAKTERQFDLIVCMSQKSFIMTSLAYPFVRKPIIWFMNDILSSDHFNRIMIFLLVSLFRFTAAHIILNSQASLEAWNKAGGRRKNVSVIFPGTNEKEIEKRIQDLDAISTYRQKFGSNGNPIVGIFGRISPWKGQDIFLEAVAQIENLNAIIVGGALFGEDEYESKLKNIVKSMNIEDRVVFTDHSEDAIKIMAACNIIVHCSTSPEPFGMVIVEAMMCETPVIASDAGGAREIILHNETGQLTPMGDSKALALAIKKYIDNPEWAAALSKKAKKRALENFSEATLIDRFLDIVKSC